MPLWSALAYFNSVKLKLMFLSSWLLCIFLTLQTWQQLIFAELCIKIYIMSSNLCPPLCLSQLIHFVEAFNHFQFHGFALNFTILYSISLFCNGYIALDWDKLTCSQRIRMQIEIVAWMYITSVPISGLFLLAGLFLSSLVIPYKLFNIVGCFSVLGN